MPVDVQELRWKLRNGYSINSAIPDLLDEIEVLRAEREHIKRSLLMAGAKDEAEFFANADPLAAREALVVAAEGLERERDTLHAQVANASHALSLAGFGGTLVEQVGAVLERVRSAPRVVPKCQSCGGWGRLRVHEGPFPQTLHCNACGGTGEGP